MAASYFAMFAAVCGGSAMGLWWLGPEIEEDE